jgi:unsaturated chondroitin disaccharide hydrolase
MIQIDFELTPETLRPRLERLLELSAAKISLLEKAWNPRHGAPVVTVQGQYTPREWTDWTRGFQYGSLLLQFDATADLECLERARRRIPEYMAGYARNIEVHDHGFNIVSTFGGLLRLAREGKFEAREDETSSYARTLQISGAVQASRWTKTADGRGYIYSFNGRHSLFADTIRSLRSLALAHALRGKAGKRLRRQLWLLRRLIQHASVTAEYSVFYGEGRDVYDVAGRVAHESLFDPSNGRYRCPGTQQGYSPFSTWTRGLGWALLGFAEELEFLATVPEGEFELFGGLLKVEAMMLRAAQATADFYLQQTPADGIPYWDTAAPGLVKMGDYLSRRADPFNDYEPVDSSAAAIAAQGLWRLGTHLSRSKSRQPDSRRYRQAALTVTRNLLDEPYLSADPLHQGLILHSVYHRPRGWDFVPPGRKIPCGESSMWGDYHARELALLLLRQVRGEPYLTFFNLL